MLGCCDVCVTILCHCRLTGTSLCAYSCPPWQTWSSVLLLPPLAVGPRLLHSWVDLVHVVSQASHWCSWPGVLLLEFSAGWSGAGWEAVLSWRPLWALSSLSYEVGLGKYGWCFFYWQGSLLLGWARLFNLLCIGPHTVVLAPQTSVRLQHCVF